MANGIDYGWAYVAQNIVTGAGGDLGSIQFKKNDIDISGSNALTYDYATTTLILSGTLYVSGTINANALNFDVTNKTVTNISATGSTKFGDTTDDLHQFTGSVLISGSNPLKLSGLSLGSLANANSYLGLDSNNNLILTSSVSVNHPVTALNNKAENRLVSVGSTTTELDGEANLTFDGSVLSVTGELTSSIGISGSVGRYTELTSSNILATGLTATTIVGTLSTAAQTNITSLGDLTGLTVDTTTLVVNGSSNKIAIGRAAPEKKLEVVDSSDSQLRLTHTASPAKHVDFRATSDGYLSIAPSNSRVGVGTTTPTAELSVTGATHISGDVGIGTTAPEFKLDVSGDARITGNLEISGTLSARVTDFQVSADTLTLGDASGDALIFNASTVSIPNNLNFDSNTLFINASSNRVGIGTALPGSTLEVNGTTTSTLFSGPIDGIIGGNTPAAGTFTTLDCTDGAFSIDNLNIDAGTDIGAALVDADLLIVDDNASGTNRKTTMSRVKTYVSDITLTTAAQTAITSVGNLSDLTVDSTTLVVNGTTNKVAIGRAAPEKKLEVVDSSDAQLRLTHTASPAKHVDFRATSEGDLYIAPSNNKVGIGTSIPTETLSISGTLDVSASANPVKIYGLQSAETSISSFLAIDSNNNLILTSSGTVITEYVSASILTYTNPGNNRLVTSVDSTSVNSEANLTFDGSLLTVTGDIQATIGISSSVGEMTELTASAITDGTALLTGGVLTGLGSTTTSVANIDHLTGSFATLTTLSATNVAGTLTTAAQANITSVGNLTNLTVDSTTLVVKSTTNRVGIGRSGPERKLEVLHVSDPQLRLTNVASTHYADFNADSSGNLTISPTGTKATFEKALFISASSNPLNIQGLAAGTPLSNSYLALDESNNIILTSAGAAGIETRNRRSITTSVTASVTDYYIGVSASAAISIQLLSAASLDDGQTYTIKDEAGNSDVNNVTVFASGSQTIDGEQYIILESSFAAINLYTNGTDKYFIF